MLHVAGSGVESGMLQASYCVVRHTPRSLHCFTSSTMGGTKRCSGPLPRDLGVAESQRTGETIDLVYAGNCGAFPRR